MLMQEDIVTLLEKDKHNMNRDHYNSLPEHDKFTYLFIYEHQKTYQGSWLNKIFSRSNLNPKVARKDLYKGLTPAEIIIYSSKESTFKTRTQRILESWGFKGGLELGPSY